MKNIHSLQGKLVLSAFERFLLINKIEEARKLSKEGHFFSEEEAREKMSRWLNQVEQNRPR